MRMASSSEPITLAVIGAGERSECYLAAFEKYYPGQYRVVAVADPDKAKQADYQKRYGIPDSMVFDGYASIIKEKRLADVAILATLDDMHYVPAIALIEAGYDLILEKPIAISLEESIAIGEAARRHPDQLVAVCHVLRFTPFFRTIKQIIDSKELGEVIDIQHNENVGYFHFAHSYVRGNWRNTRDSAPFIVAKCCHDMDILLYLLGDKHCKSLSSFGELSFFNEAHYDEATMAPRCINCPREKECPFDCVRIYKVPMIATVPLDCSSPEAIQKTFSTSPYGRCVFHSDNNVPDHQVVAMEFEGGVTASFNVSAFTKYTERTIKVMCEYGEIRGRGNTNEIEVIRWDSDEIKTIKIPASEIEGGHDGGDEGFVRDFMDCYGSSKGFASRIELSIESHVMAFASELSRLESGKSIDIQQLWREKAEER